MPTVKEIAAEIVGREGGFVNDPDDPGGATKYGVTLATLKRLGIDKTGDGKVDVGDVKALTRADAERIFIEHYFEQPRIGELPAMLQPSVFDMNVNAGTNSIKILQQMLTRMGFRAADDGKIGPETLGAALGAALAAPDHLADAYAIARRNYYYAVADARPASRKYARRNDGGKGGWITRAEEFMAPRYRLTDAQHKARVAKWG